MKESLQEATQRALVEGYKNLKENKSKKTEAKLEDLQMEIYELIQTARKVDKQDKDTNKRETAYAIMQEYPEINRKELINYISKKVDEIYAGDYDEKTEGKKVEGKSNVVSALKEINVSSFQELRDEIEDMLEKEIINEEYEDFLDIISDQEEACEDYIRRRSDVTNTDYEDEIGIESDYVTSAIQDLISFVSKTESKKITEAFWDDGKLYNYKGIDIQQSISDRGEKIYSILNNQKPFSIPDFSTLGAAKKYIDDNNLKSYKEKQESKKVETKGESERGYITGEVEAIIDGMTDLDKSQITGKLIDDVVDIVSDGEVNIDADDFDERVTSIVRNMLDSNIKSEGKKVESVERDFKSEFLALPEKEQEKYKKCIPPLRRGLSNVEAETIAKERGLDAGILWWVTNIGQLTNFKESKKVEAKEDTISAPDYLEKAFEVEVEYWLEALVDEDSNDEIGKKAQEVLDDKNKIKEIVNELVDGSDDLWEDIHRRIEELAGLHYRESSRVNESKKVIEGIDYKQAAEQIYNISTQVIVSDLVKNKDCDKRLKDIAEIYTLLDKLVDIYDNYEELEDKYIDLDNQAEEIIAELAGIDYTELGESKKVTEDVDEENSLDDIADYIKGIVDYNVTITPTGKGFSSYDVNFLNTDDSIMYSVMVNDDAIGDKVSLLNTLVLELDRLYRGKTFAGIIREDLLNELNKIHPVDKKITEAYYYNWKDDIDEVDANSEATDELWYEVAENIKNTDQYYADWDVYDIMADIISIWKIEKRSRLYDYLIKWYGSEEELLKNVRDVYDKGNAIYFVTGCGYSIWSADLLGGTADGQAERDFDRFVDNGGKR